ncbi:MAG: UDP-N-acetylmuramoyl-tripeptide--D-alanyl-D-alanine ligase [Clostridiales bacterium]|nr:UDP-N-acetylmuramoyl-tripeptide--D-alanyl-D-alanine ligase [Clostridiales bacterium]
MNMKPLPLSAVAEATGGLYIGDSEKKSAPVTGVVRDNREIKPGNLFVCIRGERVDGHDFANLAFRSGAVCCLAEHELNAPEGPYILVKSTLTALKELGAFYRGMFDIPLIGVTGSVGKTTAKEMTAAVLSAKLSVLKTAENLNNEIGVPLTLLSLSKKHEAAVIEMGISDFGEMSRLGKMVRPDICLMTAIGHSHLETLGDLNGVLKAKSEVFAYMKPDSVAVVNGDDELLYSAEPGIRKITFGLGERCDYRAENIVQHGIDGISADIVYPGGRLEVFIPAFGRHMVLSALPAVVIGHRLGLTDEEIREGIMRYAPVGGRANIINTGYIMLIDDCYNANPNSVSASVRSLCTLNGRRVAILGDMKELGGESKRLHEETGRLAAENGVDLLITCGETAEHIHNGFVIAGKGKEAEHFSSITGLLAELPSMIKKGDNVLVKASHSMHFEEIAAELKKLY